MNKDAKIYVAGSTGMLGSSIVRRLLDLGYTNLIVTDSKTLDLRNQIDVDFFFKKQRPEYVFVAAATVGGIGANNTYRAEFIYNNLLIATNVIHCAYKYGVKKMLNLGSNCIYPKNAQNPIKEEYLLTGELEQTNEPYAIAKIATIKLGEAYRAQYGCNFISAMPCNLYGEGDHYDLEKCHVMPALIRKFHEAKVNNSEVVIWGNQGTRREFLYVDDCADACIFLMNNYNESSLVNIGSGIDFKISEIALLISKVIGFKGVIAYDHSKPTGTKKKLLDVTKVNNIGWRYNIPLKEGIEKTYNHILENKIHEQWS